MPMTKDLSHLLPQVIEIARSAGQLILDIYENKQYEAYTKSDETPVTSADIAAHKLITKQLSELTPDIPASACKTNFFMSPVFKSARGEKSCAETNDAFAPMAKAV